MKILVAEPIADAGLDRLRAEGFEVDVRTDLTPEVLLDVIVSYDALIVRSATKVTEDVIARASNLKVVGRAGTGVDNVDVDAATRHGILVVNAPQSNSLSAAEHAIALMLAQARNIPAADRSLKEGRWDRSRFGGVELHGKTLAIIGLGRIGSLVAQRAMAFGMKVIAVDPYVSKQRASQMGVELVPLEEALQRGDFITLHMAKTPETAALIGEKELALMKPTARIVNVSRGGMVDEAALARAISAGRIAGAGLDVFADEPPASSPLFDLERVVLTPHLAGSTEEAQDAAGVTIAEQVSLALRGEIAQYAVNVDIGREIAEEVRPFLGLALKLGRIFTHIATDVHAVRFTVSGQIAELDTRILSLSALRGMLSAAVMEPVTFVNAPLLAEERGITFEEVRTAVGSSYVNEFEISSSDGTAVSGTIVGRRNEERITGVYDFKLEMSPGRYMCFLRYDDRPGVIGAIGSVLGGRGINIADMHVGRRERGGEALMALTLDQDVDQATIDELAEGSGAKDARFIDLAP